MRAILLLAAMLIAWFPVRAETPTCIGEGGKSWPAHVTADGFFLCLASGQQLSGVARVIDGDTIEFGGQRVRLWGIDAPERSQTCISAAGVYECGRDASATLAALLRGRSVTCEVKDHDRYGRTVATCSTDAGDIGSAMITAGWAVDFKRYSHGRYAAEQAEAKAAKRGIWSGNFEMPEQWRKARR